jgi:hypothetical protein
MPVFNNVASLGLLVFLFLIALEVRKYGFRAVVAWALTINRSTCACSPRTGKQP